MGTLTGQHFECYGTSPCQYLGNQYPSVVESGRILPVSMTLRKVRTPMWEEYPIRDDVSADELRSTATAKENGFDQLVVWCARPASAVRTRRDGIPAEPVRFEKWQRGVLIERTSRMRNQTDQDEIDDGIDEYLVAAGCEPIPRGFDWHIKVPDSIRPPSQLWNQINVALREHAPRSSHPRDMRAALEAIVPRLLGQSALPQE